MLPGPSLPLAILAGRADDMRAEIMVRTSECQMGGGPLHLMGTLVGPRRGRDMTLPTTVKLVDVTGDHAAAGDAGQALARAVFTEPAYWTPELPNLYRLLAEVQRGDQTVAIVDRMVGLRRLGVRGRSLWLEGRRWVPRGVTVSQTGFDPIALRSLPAAAVINDPSDAICAAADQAGVAIIAVLRDADDQPFDRDTAARRIAAWALHPSVVLVVVPRTANAEESMAIIAAVRPLKGTTLVGLEVVMACHTTAGGCGKRTSRLWPSGPLPRGTRRSTGRSAIGCRRHLPPGGAVREPRTCRGIGVGIAASWLRDGAARDLKANARS
jgi:hypothetical protein